MTIVGGVLGGIVGKILIFKTNNIAINNRQNSIVSFKVSHIRVSNINNENEYFEVPYSKIVVADSKIIIAGDKNYITLFPKERNTLVLVENLVRGKNV